MGLLDKFRKKNTSAQQTELQRARDFMLPPDVTTDAQQTSRDLMEAELKGQRDKRDSAETT